MTSDLDEKAEARRQAPHPARGSYAEGFGAVARCFAQQLSRREQIGAAISVFHRGVCVVDLHGGLADVASARAWEPETRIVVFSVTKGFAAMAFHLLADRGDLDWDAPVATYWPGFARDGKEAITVRTLLSHRAGLPYLDAPLTLEDCLDPKQTSRVLSALERQRPAWTPGLGQGYHAITFGLYASELFQRIAGEPMGAFLRRELFDPLDSDARLGTEAVEDAAMATLYPPGTVERLVKTIGALITAPDSLEARILRETLRRDSVVRRAFTNPRIASRRGIAIYNDVAVRRSSLAWASATASARGVARAYLPFASGGKHAGHQVLRAGSLTDAYARQGWSERDAVLQKPVGWSHGFLKEEPHLFSPTLESFGHAGMGGALGWADPVRELAIGYVMNRMDHRVRSPRALALCHALYACPPVRDGGG